MPRHMRHVQIKAGVRYSLVSRFFCRYNPIVPAMFLIAIASIYGIGFREIAIQII